MGEEEETWADYVYGYTDPKPSEASSLKKPKKQKELEEEKKEEVKEGE